MINGLLGIINICGFNFVVGITEKQYVAKLDGASIYLVKRIEMIPFSEDTVGQMQVNSQLKDYVEGVKKLLMNGFFYFSYNTDLTSNR